MGAQGHGYRVKGTGAGYTVDPRRVEHSDGSLQPEAREGYLDHARRRQRVPVAQRYAHLSTQKNHISKHSRMLHIQTNPLSVQNFLQQILPKKSFKVYGLGSRVGGQKLTLNFRG